MILFLTTIALIIVVIGLACCQVVGEHKLGNKIKFINPNQISAILSISEFILTYEWFCS